ncbi:MAG: toll/interleukin-1 receptor domain-containing protein [Candidatus Eisenbacteria sp.]|nr:toll/interleukin-1 receptor domain-containing protein [Candidatus Eisenbacteria bacterium]
MAAPSVFISHSSKDRTIAERVCQALESQGIGCWIAPRNILPGQDYREAIIAAINVCPSMVLVFSSSSNSSNRVQREIERAASKGCTIIPFRIEDTPLSAKLELDLSSQQWLDALDPPIEMHLDRLVEAVGSALQNVCGEAGGGTSQSAPADSGSGILLGRRSARWNTRWIAASLAAAIILGGSLVAWQLRTRQPDQVVPPNASELQLTSGSVMLRSEGISQQLRAHGDSTTPMVLRSYADRTILVTNRAEPAAALAEGASGAVLTFQVNNHSDETIAIAAVEAILIAAVHVYEDVIPEPIAPHVRAPIADLRVAVGSPPLMTYAILDSVFGDDDTPHDHLSYHIVSNTAGELVRARISANQELDLYVAESGGGSATIVVRAEDPFELCAEESFRVTVVPKGLPYPGLQLAGFQPLDRCPVHSSIGTRPDEYVFSEHRIDLGTVLFSFDVERANLLSWATSGDLLGGREIHVMEAQTVQSFTVQLHCHSAVDHAGGRGKPDRLVGWQSSRRWLPAHAPRRERSFYLFTVMAHVNAQSGESADLISDRVLVLGSRDDPLAGDPPSTGFVDSWHFTAAGLSVEDVLLCLVTNCVKTFGETQALERARVCLATPEDLDVQQVSPYCYFGDEGSPFRCTESRKGAEVSEPWARSNLRDLLATLRRDRRLIWGEMEGTLNRMLHDSEPALQKKVRFIHQGLSSSRAGVQVPVFLHTIRE